MKKKPKTKQPDQIKKAFAVVMSDQYGTITYTFYDKKKRDEFYKILTQ